jgi:hypothetical protein
VRYSVVVVNTAGAPSSARSASTDSGTRFTVSEKSMRGRRGVENHHVVVRFVLRFARIPHPTV